LSISGPHLSPQALAAGCQLLRQGKAEQAILGQRGGGQRQIIQSLLHHSLDGQTTMLRKTPWSPRKALHWDLKWIPLPHGQDHNA
jgi:hypothetical protein